MTPRRYALLAAAVFSLIAVLQLLRAIFAWPVTIDTKWWGMLSFPAWPSWIAFIFFAALAGLGFVSFRKAVPF